MKIAFKYIALVAGLFCFWLACQDTKPGDYSIKQEIDTPLTSINQLSPLGGYGEVSAQAIPRIAGRDWRFWRLSDSTFAIMSQDTSNSLESIIREDSLLAWIQANAGFGEITQVDSLPVMYSSAFPLNTRVINKQTGAIYNIQSTAVSGYTTDSILVVPTGSNYAVLESYEGKIYFSHVNQSGNGDTEIVRKMMTFAYVGANKHISTVVIDEDCYLTDTIMIPATVSLIGTYQGVRTRTNNGRYSTLYLNLNDANKTAITTEDHVYATADQYFPGGQISNLNIEALSPGHTIFRLIRPGWVQIHDIRIGSGPTQPTNFSTRYYDYAFRFDDALKTKFYDIEIRNSKKWAIWAFDGGGTTYLENVRLDGNANGIKIDSSSMSLENVIIENCDSVGLRVMGGDALMRYCYFETVPNTAIDVDAIQLGGGPGSLTMRSSRMNSPFLTADPGLVCIATDDFDFLWIEDCEFHNYPTQISTTANQGQIFWQNEWKTGITNPVSSFSGITDLTKFNYQNGQIAHFSGSLYAKSLTNGAVKSNSSGLLTSMSYTELGDSLSQGLTQIIGGASLSSTTQMDLNNKGWWIEDTGGGHITIGNAFDYGRGILQLNGVGYSTQGWSVGSQSWYRSYNTSGGSVNIMRYNSSDNLEIGNTGINSVSITSGSGSTKNISLTAGGTVNINSIMKLNPTTVPSSPGTGTIYMDSGDNHAYLWNGSAWVQLDN